MELLRSRAWGSFLLLSWRCIAGLLSVFTVYAFWVQLEENNPLGPAFLCLIAAVGALAGAILLQMSRNRKDPHLLRLVCGALGVITLPFVPLMAIVAEQDDAPGAMLLALFLLGLAVTAFLTLWGSYYPPASEEGLGGLRR